MYPLRRFSLRITVSLLVSTQNAQSSGRTDELPGRLQARTTVSKPRGLALISSGSKQRPDSTFITVTRSLAEKMRHLPPILAIKKRGRKRPGPSGLYHLVKRRFTTRFFSIVWEYRLVSRYESPHQNHVAIIIHADAHDLQPLRSILFGQLVQHGVLVAAGLAPRRPERNQQRFPTVRLQQFLIAVPINQLRIAYSSSFGSLRRSKGRNKREHHQYDKSGPSSHSPAFHLYSIHTPAG